MIISLVLGFSATCISLTESTIPFQPVKLKKGEGKIYFYRVYDEWARGLDIKIFYKDPKKEYSFLTPGDLVADLKMGAFCPVSLPPGKHQFIIMNRSQNVKKNSNFTFELKSEEALALKLKINESNDTEITQTSGQPPEDLVNSKLDCGFKP
ncbi:hypothetical protein JWG40_10435 [Leptospira sp. 201903074]|uniref:hypothetical protein n=1 Tax=Leptospira abararensis TaxID=2810036 RepID=UPI0019663C63|nr:hypothetical protein [Leptospira abararensis]MBM9547434.1 hypothetical protein [Leptospira abararensis]